jgi:hypothetical protein
LWERFLEGGSFALKRRRSKEALKISLLREKLGDLTIEIEPLRKKMEQLEAGLPSA